ncbi:hypothetical protein PFICI_00149 [Pestalotiopsis fici W106-1]|uniref:Uncharacterized protein n=1 Tax=Pestalotiopsis fici (strain W106-1 / CGMCC3.15140) TaxID=1229662 RepID=W3XM36_PESFW|nr:uncharacterized protein PFICI_00149 [Pestalotiopsis fici W106-1]ETS86321.1 hypothetical protein PFICI_00149 [Pestalotiopsis fici W106-1]
MPSTGDIMGVFNGHSSSNGINGNELTELGASNEVPINGTSGPRVNGTNGYHVNGKNGTDANGTNGTHSYGTNGTHVNGTNGGPIDSVSGGSLNGIKQDVGGDDLEDMPIAICGTGCRLPGGIRSSSDLFNFLSSKGDARSIVPEDRYNIDAYYDPTGKPGSVATKYGYFLDLDLSQFDASMFGMSNAEVATLDPAQRLLLEITRETFESAGEADFRGKNIGTFIGGFTTDWEDMQNTDPLNFAPYQMSGKNDFALSNRLAFEYDLLGPSINMKTACSATAEAVHTAVMAIRSGSCPSAIVAGANMILTPRASIGMSAMGLLAADGNCKTFDAGANGFARGESVCAIYIKRLDHAIRDGNPIRAVIRGVDSNCDGGDGSRTFGTPNAIAQEKLIRQTYTAAGLALADTSVVELHGTGTPVGDPLETTAIANCFGGDKKVYIGSIKPNVGHGEGSSALASLIKSVVALSNKTILPNIKFSKPNPKIPWDRNLQVPVEPLPWPKDFKERISINSFGLGGSNVHVRITQPRGGLTRNGEDVTTTPKHKSLLLLSGNSVGSIQQLSARYGQYLEKNPTHLDAMVYTLASRRERLKLGSYCVVNGLGVGEPVTPVESQGARHVAFVFTGQGAQWVGMGREMMLENAEFIASIRQMDTILKSVEHPPKWTLEETLLAESAEKALLNQTDRSQPICTAVQVAYVDALAAWDIRPSAVVGHSSGEIAGAYAAGVLSLKEAIITAYYRGYAFARNEVPGTMAAVGAGRDVVEQHLKPGVVIACENSKASVTISGDLEAMEETMAALKQMNPDLFVRQLRVPMAYHSHHMKAIGNLYKSLLAPHLAAKAPRVPFYSTVYGRRVRESKEFGPHYWQVNMENPVLFHTAVLLMLADLSDTAHLEIGPHSALAGPLRHIYKEAGHTVPYASVAERGEDASHTFLSAIGKVHCFGIRPQAPTSEHAYTLPDLPTYSWNYESSHWSETRTMANWRFRKHRKHELLGLRLMESSDVEPTWRNVIRLGDVAWLADHCVESDIVFPAAGYIAMAGTAIAQLTGSSAYTVQDVHITTALRLDEGNGVEVVTSLRKHALTASNNSKWWEFSITSENNGTWIKHCSGLVTDGCAVASPSNLDVSPHVRKIEPNRWYQALGRVGLNYSNRFVGLDEITASPVDHSASASITDRQDATETYALHPSTLDLVLQSWSVAAARGEYRQLDSLFLPTFIENFYVGDHGSERTIQIRTTSRESAGMNFGSSYGVVNGDNIAYVLNGFEATRMDGASARQADELKAWSVQWHPAFDFAAPETLLRPARDVTADSKFVEQYSLMCSVEVHYEAATVTSLAQPFFKHYLAGIAKQMDQVDQGLSMVPDAKELKALSREARQQKLVEWRETSKGTSAKFVVEALWRVYANIKDVLEGRVIYLDLLLGDGVLSEFYNEANAWSDIGDFFRVLGLSKPQLRVLEIGAGTGGTTSVLLEALHSKEGERLYGDYTITDVSAGFVNQTKERFRDYLNLKFAVCDITLDPLEQGFEAASYDLIVASNVIHATPSLVETLTRCRTLLKPDGQIFMQEVCSNTRYVDVIMGLFDGWWAGIDDGRVERPVVSEEVWDAKLRQSGFQGIHAAVHDNKDPHFFCSTNIVARARPDVTPVSDKTENRITLLKLTAELSEFGQNVKNALEAQGKSVDECVWGSKPAEGQDIISLLDADNENTPLLAEIDTGNLEEFVNVVGDVLGQAVFWVMRSASTQCADPNYGQMLGVARCIRAELAIDFVTLELDHLDMEASQAVARVYTRVQQARKTAAETDDASDTEFEYAWRAGQVLVSRLHTMSVDAGLADAAPQVQAKHLTIGQPGSLQSLCWTGHQLPPLNPDAVQVRVTAACLNFHDVAVAMGLIAPDGPMESDGYHGLGGEGAGVVTAVGSNVDHVTVGDRVLIMEVEKAVFATEVQVDADMVVQAPANVSDEDAAGLVIPYLTVLWSLVEKAHMEHGQTVLIHCAAGGVGIAAINVARWLGLEIYCTVGSQAKVDFLTQKLGVPRDHIFHSRNDSFVADVLRATNGTGVDVVLNSLSGELLHASWKCVSSGGSMVDLGKLDSLARGRLNMGPFADNRAFFGVDLVAIYFANKRKIVRLLHKTVELLRDGHIFPLHPTTIFEAENIQDAFRYMHKGLHKGRIVVKMPTDVTSLSLTLPVPKPKFSPNGVYLVAGGLGGLGQSIISWMVSNGARQIMVVSRSAGTRDEHNQFVLELRELGCELRCFAGDVADLEFMRDVVAAARGPVKGVLQLAMVLKDTGILNMDHESWTTATNPKIRGTWNLHQLLPEDLDFFVMCSSANGTLGHYGQANYAAGNAYLDAFVHFRHGLGLPAAVLDIAAVSDVGYVASNKTVAERLERGISRFMSETDFLRCLHLSIERSSRQYIKPAESTLTTVYEDPAQVVLYNEMTRPLSDPQNMISWRLDPRLSVFRNNELMTAHGDVTGSQGLRSFLISLSSEPEKLDDEATVPFFAQEIAKRICAFLMRDDDAVDTSQTLSSLGADSLVAIEIRNWWKQTLGIEITVLELADANTTMDLLGALAVQRLKEKHAAK